MDGFEKRREQKKRDILECRISPIHGVWNTKGIYYRNS